MNVVKKTRREYLVALATATGFFEAGRAFSEALEVDDFNFGVAGSNPSKAMLLGSVNFPLSTKLCRPPCFSTKATRRLSTSERRPSVASERFSPSASSSKIYT